MQFMREAQEQTSEQTEDVVANKVKLPIAAVPHDQLCQRIRENCVKVLTLYSYVWRAL